MANHDTEKESGFAAKPPRKAHAGRWLWWLLFCLAVICGMSAANLGRSSSALIFAFAALLAVPASLKALRDRQWPSWLVYSLSPLLILIGAGLPDANGPKATPGGFDAPGGQGGQPAALTGSPSLEFRLEKAASDAKMFLDDDIQGGPQPAQDYAGPYRNQEIEMRKQWVAVAFEAMKAKSLGTDARANLDTLRAKGAAYQARELPRVRRGFGKELSQRLFRQNIEVSVSGKASDRLTLTGAAFFNNANVVDIEEALEPQMRPIRFRSVTYRPYDGAKSWVYRLDGAPDGELGRVEGDQFFSASHPGANEVAFGVVDGRWVQGNKR